MSIKKDTLGNISQRSLEEAFRCSECLHFKRHAHPAKKEICHNLGVKAFGIAPKCFTPDVTQIANNSDTFVQLAALFADYTPRQKRIMLAVLKQKPIKGKNIRRDLPFGTKVYFHSMGKDYISNYLAGFVVGLTSSSELILTGSPEQNTRGKSYYAYMSDTDQLMTYKEWKVKKAELKAAGRILDPQAKIALKANADYEPPTIDSAPSAWHDKQEKQRKKSRIAPADMVMQIS